MGIPNLGNQQMELSWGSDTLASCFQVLPAWPMFVSVVQLHGGQGG